MRVGSRSAPGSHYRTLFAIQSRFAGRDRESFSEKVCTMWLVVARKRLPTPLRDSIPPPGGSGQIVGQRTMMLRRQSPVIVDPDRLIAQPDVELLRPNAVGRHSSTSAATPARERCDQW